MELANASAGKSHQIVDEIAEMRAHDGDVQYGRRVIGSGGQQLPIDADKVAVLVSQERYQK